MNIVVTGLSGFLGKSIFKVNGDFNHNIIGIGRNAINKIVCNLKSEIPKIPKKTELIIHAAGLAHSIPSSIAENNAFFETNFHGTVNLIEGINISKTTLKQFIFISSVSVYGIECGHLIDESNKLSGLSSYAKSKIKAEKFLTKWSKKTKTPLLILRLPLLIGHNPKGNLLKLLQTIKKGFHVSIKNNHAKKSMVLVDDVAKFLLSQVNSNGIYNLSGPRDYSILELENAIKKYYSKKSIISIPYWVLFIISKIGDKIRLIPINSNILIKLTSELTFCDRKARKILNWNPNDVMAFFNTYKLKQEK